MTECEFCGEPAPPLASDLGTAVHKRWHRWARQHEKECEEFRQRRQMAALLLVGAPIALVGGALAVGAIAGILATAASPFVIGQKAMSRDEEGE